MSFDRFISLRRSAEAGNPIAAAYTAVLVGLGAGEAQDWPLAVRRLAQAAELGSEPARGQLRVLSGRTDEAWAEMPEDVDLGPWLERAVVEPVAGSPRILVSRDFLPACGVRMADRPRRGTARPGAGL